jgi:hypothetical protein
VLTNEAVQSYVLSKMKNKNGKNNNKLDEEAEEY